MSEYKWYGIICDRLTGRIVAQTDGKTSLKRANRHVAAFAKRKGFTGDRYAINLRIK